VKTLCVRRPVSHRHSIAIGCLHVAGTAALECHRVAVRRQAVCAFSYEDRNRKFVGEGENIQVPQVLQSRLNPAQAALGASPIAARLGPSPRGSHGARAGRESTYCARARARGE